MRRILPLFLTSCLASGLAACGAADATPTLATPTATPATTAAASAPPPAATGPAPTVTTLEAAGLSTKWMDPRADACADFYQLTCGGLLDHMDIPADEAVWGPGEELAIQNEEFLRSTLEKAAKDPGGDAGMKKLGAWYGACMNEDALEKAGAKPLEPIFQIIAKARDKRGLYDALIALHKRAIFPIFDVTSQQDFKDATLVIAALDQDGLGMPDRDYYLHDDAHTKEIREFYRGHVERMLGLLGDKPAAAKSAADDVMRIETALAKIAQDKVIRRDPHKIYNKIDRDGLVKAAKGFPWELYFKELGFPAIKDITVNSPDYFAGADALLASEKPATWQSYLRWTALRSQASHLSAAFVKERFAYRQKLTGQKELAPRWKRCTRSADSALGEVLAQQYVQAKFDAESKRAAEVLLEAIRSSMGRELGKLAWMDGGTRSAAQDKLGKMNRKIGYPAKWRSYDFAVSATTYAENELAADAFELGRVMRKVGKPVDRDEWQMTPPTVNAYYDPSLNEMVFPAGILQPPYFAKRFADAVNFGATGAVMGHELTHGFDDEGSQFDGTGNLRNWWSEATEKLFKEQTQCVSDQYSGYEAVPGVHVNGDLTLGENIADIGGIKLAYQAYKEARKSAASPIQASGYSEDQLFFLAYGQSWCTKARPEVLELMAKTNPHSPPHFRVNGVLADTPAFVEAFACKAGTPMHPAKVCGVW